MGRPWIAVLGSSSGFGEATCRAFAQKGYGVFGVHLDRRGAMPKVEALIADLRANDVPVVFHNGNAADDEERGKALAALRGALGEGDTVRVLLHSLAFGTLRPYFSDAEPTIERRHLEMTVDVMAHSLVYWTQDLVKSGLLTTGGRVFAMTSAGSFAAWPAYGAVSAAKCALESHIRQLAIELAPKGITANAVLAGVTMTAALEKIPGASELARRALERNPHKRLTTPADIAQCLLGLSGPESAWLTGNILRVDGGESISG